MTTTLDHSSDNSKLNGLQSSLLRLFQQGMNEEEEFQVRKMLVDYFDQRLQKELSEVLDKKNYSTQDYHRMLSDDNFKSK
jgi:hypothetical protein